MSFIVDSPEIKKIAQRMASHKEPLKKDYLIHKKKTKVALKKYFHEADKLATILSGRNNDGVGF